MRRCGRRSLFAGVLLVLVSLCEVVPALAQTINPSRAEFTPSPDHNTVVGGTALVTSYSLDFYQSGATAPFRTSDLGKPTPDPDGIIRIDLTTIFIGWPTGTTYSAVVSAVGPGGTTASAPSNTFTFAAPCAPTISPTTQSVVAGGGASTATVTAGTGCTWSAASNVPWITITSGTSGSGSGSVGYTVAANTVTASRTGTLTIAGQTLTVTQAAPCSYTVSPTTLSLAAAGGPGAATVTTTGGCTWTASSSVSWITVTAGATGSGNGTVSFTVAANASSTARNGTLTIAGRTVTVSQSGACTFTVSPTSQTTSSAGGTMSSTVTTMAGCSWTAVSTASWITVNAGSGGTGSGLVSYGAAANTSTAQRLGSLTIAGQTVTVTQDGAPSAPLPPGNLHIVTN